MTLEEFVGMFGVPALNLAVPDEPAAPAAPAPAPAPAQPAVPQQ
jgi:hypothetical protein